MFGQRVGEVPIERLSFGLSPRAGSCDPDHVAALAEVLDQLPPIVVHASTLRVIDGVHRVLAARWTGRATIRAVLFEGDETAVRIEAVRNNIMHGKPLTLAEREAAAVKIIEHVPDWSDRRIATVTGLSPKTVARLRGRAAVDSAQSSARLGRDGRRHPVDASDVRQRVADAVRADPEASNRAISRLTGASQATVRDVRERLHRGVSAILSRSDRALGRRPRPPAARATEPAEPPPQGGVSSPESVPEDFTAWFEQRSIDLAEWKSFVDRIPLSRVYELADACRECSESWRAFSLALEDRARTRKRN